MHTQSMLDLVGLYQQYDRDIQEIKAVEKHVADFGTLSIGSASIKTHIDLSMYAELQTSVADLLHNLVAVAEKQQRLIDEEAKEVAGQCGGRKGESESEGDVKEALKQI